ncbi:hypothetical protein PIB30_061583 [Stylosanthes scabra]|uniref:Uncharacterized protein n=1 Tax=Stylosanthes scabra TaxID=79078 RepID=A0ABU6QKC4_9FABA|nr:hypothetical protein [Stylosanthes scabra]
MGVRVGGDEAQEEADLFARYEEEGDDRDQPHPAGYGAPQPFPSAASPDPFFHATLDAGTLDEVFDMIRAPDTIIMSQAASYRTGRDQRLDPSSSAFVASPLLYQGMGYTVNDFASFPAQYGTPPAYYDFLSGPNPTPQQDESAAREPSPPPPPGDPRGRLDHPHAAPVAIYIMAVATCETLCIGISFFCCLSCFSVSTCS